MIVHQLNLANFRGFEQIELVFEPDVSVVAGVNGVGKSGILQALAALFSRALPELLPRLQDRVPSLTKTFIMTSRR